MGIHTLLKASGNRVPRFCTQALPRSALGRGESRFGSRGRKARLPTAAWSVRARALPSVLACTKGLDYNIMSFETVAILL